MARGHDRVEGCDHNGWKAAAGCLGKCKVESGGEGHDIAEGSAGQGSEKAGQGRARHGKEGLSILQDKAKGMIMINC